MTRVLRQKKACPVINPQMPPRKCPQHLIWGLHAWWTLIAPCWGREKRLDATDKPPLINLIPLPLSTLIRLSLFKRWDRCWPSPTAAEMKNVSLCDWVTRFPFSTWKYMLNSFVCVGPRNAEQKSNLFSLETHRENIYQGLIGYNMEILKSK